MRPSSSELIEGIRDALRTRIAPLVADQPWPASELRSIDALLAHLAVRVEHEVNLLVIDNADLRTLLCDLAASGLTGQTAIREVLDAWAPTATDADPTDTGRLQSANLAYRTVLEATIHELHRGDRAELLVAVREYLKRAATRDRQIYRPLIAQSMF